jgi:hypothetical protein
MNEDTIIIIIIIIIIILILTFSIRGTVISVFRLMWLKDALHGLYSDIYRTALQ